MSVEAEGGQFVSTLNEYGREPIVINVNMSGRLQLVSSVNENSGAKVGGGEVMEGGWHFTLSFAHSFIHLFIFDFMQFIASVMDIPNFNFLCEQVPYVRDDPRLNRVCIDYFSTKLHSLT